MSNIAEKVDSKVSDQLDKRQNIRLRLNLGSSDIIHFP